MEGGAVRGVLSRQWGEIGERRVQLLDGIANGARLFRVPARANRKSESV